MGHSSAASHLQAALADENFFVRRRAIQTLNNFASEELIPVLLNLLKSDRRLWSDVSHFLNKYMSPFTAYLLCKAVTEPTTQQLTSPFTRLAGKLLTPMLLICMAFIPKPFNISYVQLLGKIGDESAITPLIKLASSIKRNSSVSQTISQAIGKIAYRKYQSAILSLNSSQTFVAPTSQNNDT